MEVVKEIEVEGIQIKNPDLIEAYIKIWPEFTDAQFSYISSLLENEKRNSIRAIRRFKDTDPCLAVQALIKLGAINFTIATLREQFVEKEDWI